MIEAESESTRRLSLAEVLRRNVPLELARQQHNVPNWLKHERRIVAVLTILAVVTALATAFSTTVYLDNNVSLWILFWLLQMPVSLRVIVAGASAFRVERSLHSDPSDDLDKLNALQTFLVKWLAVLRRTWSWSLIYGLPMLVVTLWANVSTPPLGDLKQHVSLTLVFGYVMFFVNAILELSLSAGLGILLAAIVRRSRDAALLACVLRLLPLVFMVGVIQIEASCECEFLSTSMEFMTTRIAEFTDGGAVSTISLTVPATSFDDIDALSYSRLMSIWTAILFSVVSAMIAGCAVWVIRRNSTLRPTASVDKSNHSKPAQSA